MVTLKDVTKTGKKLLFPVYLNGKRRNALYWGIDDKTIHKLLSMINISFINQNIRNIDSVYMNHNTNRYIVKLLILNKSFLQTVNYTIKF